MAQVLPFPLVRRRNLIRRQARFYADQAPQAAEKNLAHQLKVQGEALVRKGVAPDVADAEVRSLERAIRCEVRGWPMMPGGAA